MSQAESSKRSQEEEPEAREAKKVCLDTDKEGEDLNESLKNDIIVTDSHYASENANKEGLTTKLDNDLLDYAKRNRVRRDIILLRDYQNHKLCIKATTLEGLNEELSELKQKHLTATTWLEGLSDEEKRAKIDVIVEDVEAVSEYLDELVKRAY